MTGILVLSHTNPSAKSFFKPCIQMFELKSNHLWLICYFTPFRAPFHQHVNLYILIHNFADILRDIADKFSIFADNNFTSYKWKTVRKPVKSLKIFIIRQIWNSFLLIFCGLCQEFSGPSFYFCGPSLSELYLKSWGML